MATSHVVAYEWQHLMVVYACMVASHGGVCMAASHVVAWWYRYQWWHLISLIPRLFFTCRGEEI